LADLVPWFYIGLLASVAVGYYLLVWADSETGEGPLHAGFTLPPGGGFLGLFAAGGAAVDSVRRALLTLPWWRRRA